MPRYYAKKVKPIDFDKILEAIKSVKMHNNSIRQAATAHNIPKSTLARYIAALDRASINVATADAVVMKNFLEEKATTGAKPVS